jgi:hypothetical protein
LEVCHIQSKNGFSAAPKGSSIWGLIDSTGGGVDGGSILPVSQVGFNLLGSMDKKTAFIECWKFEWYALNISQPLQP